MLEWLPVKKKIILFVAITLPPFSYCSHLDVLIQNAINNHPSVKSSFAQLNAAREAKKSVIWQFFPKPSIQAQNASSSKNNPNFQGDDVVYSISLEQPIWQGGKRISELNQASIDVVIAQSQVNEKKYDIALELVQAYGKWLSSFLKIQALNTSIKKHEKMLQRVKNRVNAGVSNHGDIDLALSRLEATRSRFLTIQYENNNALAHIIEIIGQPVTSFQLAQNIAKPKKQHQSLEKLIAITLTEHPSMKIVRYKSKKAERKIRSSQSSLWPEVFFRAERQYGHFAIKDAKPMNTFLVGVRSQLGAGLSNLSDIKMSSAKLRAAKMDIDVKKRKLRRQITEGMIMTNSLYARKKSAEITLRSTKNVFSSYSRQFLAGKKSWLDLMNSLREMTNNEMTLADINASLVVVTTRHNINIHGLSGYMEKIQ